MPAQETVDLRALGDQELGGELEDAHQTLFNLRFQAATRQLANVAQVGKARRRIARIRTLLREREIIADADLDAAQDAASPDDGTGGEDASAPDEGASGDDGANDEDSADGESGEEAHEEQTPAASGNESRGDEE